MAKRIARIPALTTAHPTDIQCIIHDDVALRIAAAHEAVIRASLMSRTLVDTHGKIVGHFVMRPVDRRTTLDDANDSIYFSLSNNKWQSFTIDGVETSRTAGSCAEAMTRAVRMCESLGIFIVWM